MGNKVVNHHGYGGGVKKVMGKWSKGELGKGHAVCPGSIIKFTGSPP